MKKTWPRDLGELRILFEITLLRGEDTDLGEICVDKFVFTVLTVYRRLLYEYGH